ncbi:MAG TPA: PaaI family thioesterase [Polyangiales bacterium]|nr:PaaI family thioesterase [Polyangiales bacterium]
MAIERTGYFWDVMEGRKPAPPAAAMLGFELIECDPEQATIRVRFRARPEFANPIGNVQGGFLSAMLDETLGPALVATLPPGQFAPTIELKVNFVRPASVGASLIGSGRVVARTRSIAFLAGELHDEAGKLIATASATARIASDSKG